VTPTQGDFDRIRRLMSSLNPLSDDVEVDVALGPVRPLFGPTAAGLDLYGHAFSLAAEIGFSPGHGTVGGGSDGNLTGALGIPTLDGLGLCGDGFHTNEEHIFISSIVPRATLLARLFETLA
jgi:glutamate carboxypeptidase